MNKDSKGFLISGTIGAVFNIVLNALFIPKLLIHGAALATCISYIVVFLYRVIDTRKYMVIHVFRFEYMIGYLLVIITALSMMITSKWGGIVLVFEFVIAVCLNKNFVLDCINGIKKIIRR